MRGISMKRFVSFVQGVVVALACASCGGGSGIGPEEIDKQEQRLRDHLPIDWSNYQAGDYQQAIEFFANTLAEAETFEGAESVLNEIKSEAHNGIGWSFFREQSLEDAWNSFQQATRLNRRNVDAWVGWAGVALARGRYADAAQFSVQALATGDGYNSAFRLDENNRQLGHDSVDSRHIRLMLAESYFQLGRYSVLDRPDPNNSAAQVRMIKGSYTYNDPGQLLREMSQIALELQLEASGGF